MLLLSAFVDLEDRSATPTYGFNKSMLGKMNVPGTQTAILRMRAVKNMPDFLDEIRSMGVTVVSDGKRTVVIEALGSVLEDLRHHPAVVGVDEPRQMQMRSLPNGNWP